MVGAALKDIIEHDVDEAGALDLVIGNLACVGIQKLAERIQEQALILTGQPVLMKTYQLHLREVAFKIFGKDVQMKERGGLFLREDLVKLVAVQKNNAFF